MNIKIDKADSAYSEYWRSKIKRCERCYSTKKLQISHFWSRRHESVRYDSENTDVLCFSCHLKFHSDPGLYEAWKRKKLGDARYDALMVRAHAYCKKDRKFQLLKIIKTAEQEGIMLSASKALEMSNKASPKKETSDIEIKLKLIEKRIQRKSKAGERSIRWVYDSEQQGAKLAAELQKAGYEVAGLDNLLLITW